MIGTYFIGFAVMLTVAVAFAAFGVVMWQMGYNTGHDEGRRLGKRQGRSERDRRNFKARISKLKPW